jgi:DNA polymerase III delta prime subunit
MAGNRRIDRILDPSFLQGLEDAALETIRDKRDETAEEEAVLSYERSLIHSRIRLLQAAQELRANAAPPSSIIDRLPEILADTNVTHRGSFPSLEPPQMTDHPRRRVEKLITDDTLARIHDLSDEDIAATIEALETAEREVSDNRRSVHVVLDRIITEIGRRKAGADV